MHPVMLLVILIALLLAVSWYRHSPKGQQRQIKNRFLLFGGLGLLLLLLLTGKLHPLFALLAGLVPLAQRLMTLGSLYQWFKSRGGPSPGQQSPGQQSEVATHRLRMTLDHDSGEMHGTVLTGSFAGREIGSLNLGELEDLLSQCATDDPQGHAILEAYLDRYHGDSRRSSGRDSPAGTGPDTLTETQAREILGLEAEASREEIITAHRRLMQKLHPDRGGSTYLAAKINRAKDLLLADR